MTLFAPAFHDRVVCDLGRRFMSGDTDSDHAEDRLGPSATRLLVVGAHLSGQPLNGELIGRGGRLLGRVRTAPSYRLYRLATTPPKPGLVRVDGVPPGANGAASSPGGGPGASIEGELWALPPAGLASLLAELPSPMTLGRVLLEDRAEAVGFLCEPAALTDAQEITQHGSWVTYLQA